MSTIETPPVSTNSAPADLNSVWSRWVERFWFLRGIATAILLAQLIPSFTDLSRFEILRFFHAVIVGWDRMMTQAGVHLGAILRVPPIDPTLINALLFAFTLGAPSAYYMHKSRWNAVVLDQFFGTGTAVKDADLKMSEGGVGKVADIAAGIVFALAYFWLYLSVVRAPASDAIAYWAVVGPLLLFHMGAVALAAWKLPGYGKGLVYFATFVATMQILYFLQLPWLSDAVRDLTDQALNT